MKKKESLFSFVKEPYRLGVLVYSAASFIFHIVKNSFRRVKEENLDDDTRIIRYNEIEKELKEDYAADAWKNFIKMGLILQIFFTGLLIWSIFLLSVWGIIQSSISLLFIVIFFGYKPHILSNKRFYTFFEYIKDNPNNLQSMMLWRFLKQVK